MPMIGWAVLSCRRKISVLSVYCFPVLGSEKIVDRLLTCADVTAIQMPTPNPANANEYAKI